MTKKIAISMPDQLLKSIDEVGREEGLSRSAVLSRAAAAYLRWRRRRQADARYIQSFREVPQTDEEMAELDSYVHSSRAWDDDDEW